MSGHQSIHPVFPIIAMIAIVFLTGSIALAIKKSAELLALNTGKMNKAGYEIVQELGKMGEELYDKENHVDNLQINQVKIHGNELFRQRELHRTHELEQNEEYDRFELARAQLNSRTEFETEVRHDRIDESALNAVQNAAKAAQKATVGHISIASVAAKQSFQTMEQNHDCFIITARNIIKSNKKSFSEAHNAG